jgi:ribose-phosphate pyrophosphokinase
MITLITDSMDRHVLESTIFPDGTSQVWKLPEFVTQSTSITVDWRFESEREIIDLLSLRMLLANRHMSLRIPYLPYGRQDKGVSNSTTFNLLVFADLINSMNFDKVFSVDAHNPDRTRQLIDNFVNINVIDFQKEVYEHTNPEYVVFPDAGARARYQPLRTTIVCEKTRDQLTGEITGHKISEGTWAPHYKASRFLIVDDLCDGGATFISVAKMLREIYPNAWVGLCVTHGIFSRGLEHLLTNGINEVYTTNSLIKNKKGYKV